MKKNYKSFLMLLLTLTMTFSFASLAFADNVENVPANIPIKCELIPLPDEFEIGPDGEPIFDENAPMPAGFLDNVYEIWLTNNDINGDGLFEIAEFDFVNRTYLGVLDPIDWVTIQVFAYDINGNTSILGGVDHTREFVLYSSHNESFQAIPHYVRGTAYIFITESGETRRYTVKLPGGQLTEH